MKAAVIGANGQLGSDLTAELRRRSWDVVGLTHADLRVEEYPEVRRVMQELRPDVVFNTAAFHIVPQCETDPVRAFQVNALGPLNVARACGEIGIRSVYYSTDYVFDGRTRRPYTEEDAPNPINVYATTKLAGEHFTLNNGTNNLVIRVCGLYGRIPCRAKGTNFVFTMVKAAKEKPEVKVVDDERLSPTSTKAVAAKSLDLLDTDALGLFHMVSEGVCSWYEFAKVIFETLRLSTPLEPPV